MSFAREEPPPIHTSRTFYKSKLENQPKAHREGYRQVGKTNKRKSSAALQYKQENKRKVTGQAKNNNDEGE